jgi:hypothetical protein
MSPSSARRRRFAALLYTITFSFLVALSIDDYDFAEPSRVGAAHFRSRHTTTVARCVYASPVLLDRNPIRLCVSSQNGLLLEPPQRHKELTVMVMIGSPLSPLSTTDPLTM